MTTPKNLQDVPLSRVKLPQDDLFYEVPDIKGVKGRFNSISGEYLEKRLDYLISRLQQRVMMTTAKHLSTYRKPALRKVEEIRGKIFDAIAGLNQGEIKNQESLGEFCGVVDSAVDAYKSEHEGTVHGSQRILQMFVEEERKVIKALVKLEAAKKPKSEEHKEAENLLADIGELLLLKDGLSADLTKANKGESDFSESIKYILANFEAILYLLEKFSSPDEINKLPGGVQVAVIDEIEKLLSQLTRFKEHVFAARKMKKDFETYDKTIDRLRAGIGYFSGLVHYRGRVDLSDVERELTGMKDDLEEVDLIIKDTGRRAEDILVKADVVFQINALRNAIKKSLDIFPEDDSHLLDLFENGGSVPAEVGARGRAVEPKVDVAQGSVRNFIDQSETGVIVEFDNREPGEDEGEVDDDKEKDEEDDKVEVAGSARKLFRWNNVESDYAAAEVRRRLCTNSLLSDLADNGRWLDFRLVLELMTLRDFQKLGLSSSCIGSAKALFQSKEELIERCFPEMSGLEAVYPSTQMTGKSAPRFRWSSDNKTAEEIQKEIKTRMFGGWPLLKELYEAQRWQELKYLFDKFTVSTVAVFRIRTKCIGSEKAPYATLPSMLKDVFPEVY